MAEYNNVKKRFLPVEYKIGYMIRNLLNEIESYSQLGEKDEQIYQGLLASKPELARIRDNTPNPFDVSVDDLSISRRKKAILKNCGYKTIDDLMVAGKRRIYLYKPERRATSIQMRTIKEIEIDLLKNYGLVLGD